MGSWWWMHSTSLAWSVAQDISARLPGCRWPSLPMKFRRRRRRWCHHPLSPLRVHFAVQCASVQEPGTTANRAASVMLRQEGHSEVRHAAFVTHPVQSDGPKRPPSSVLRSPSSFMTTMYFNMGLRRRASPSEACPIILPTAGPSTLLQISRTAFHCGSTYPSAVNLLRF
jgi:hypothetical protein